MTFKFDLEIFGKCLQGLGQGLMQGGILMDTTRMIHRRGMYGGMSIWGCGTFMPGGFTPPLNIWHPMYAGNTTNPYLIQQGNNIAGFQAKEIFDQAYEYYKKQEQQFTPQITDSQQTTQTEIGKQIQEALQNESGEYSITTSQYNALLNKQNKTAEEEQLLDTAYKASVKSAGESYMNYADKEYGNSDGSLTKDEFTEYIMGTINGGTDCSITDEGREAIEAAFNKLNIDDNGKISKDEMSAFIGYLDTVIDGKKDGKITGAAFFKALEAFESDSNMKATLQQIHSDLYSE